MGFTPNITNTFFLLAILVVLLPAETYAFGAGDIPDFAYLNDKAFRHGDIENILENLVKSAGHAAIGGGEGGLLGFASSVIKHVAGGKKFSKSDVKKVYFGNWLRDYSQAMDIAGLSKLSADTLVLVVAVLGFMTFGFASEEFEVTADRLGVYLPVEHIDNPKGYAEKEGDARNFHPKLRPPVNFRELEIDNNTGMKKYIATENQGWDTSTAFIRRTFRACIEHGRRAGGRENAELWEAYRLLGTGLHTMEDLLAHSNWCELALRKLGHRDVFCHVGDRVSVNTPNGPAPPLVTGTFGSADFLHSLLGEATDKLSQASVTDLSQKISNSSPNKGPDIDGLKKLISKFGGGDESKLDQGEEIKKQSQGYNFNPDNVCPPDVQKKLLDLLKWHDDVMRTIIQKIEMVPGLSNLLEEFSNDLNEYIYTVLAPYLGPILTQATSALNEGSKAVIDTDDQYEVFNNPNASDPSHSLLSKDHFGLILNEPAGKIAQIVVENSVNLIVEAWSNNNDPDQVINRILEAFHHPYYATGRSEIQEKMYDHMSRWIGGYGNEKNEILSLLTKESVRDHKNKRPGLEETEEAGYGGCGHGYKPKPSGTSSNTYGQSQTSHGGAYAAAGAAVGYGAQSAYSNTQSHGQSHGGSGYGSQRRDDDDNRTGGYQQPHRQDNPPYGGRRDDDNSYGSQRRDDNSYGGSRRDDNPYGGPKRDDGAYGSQRRDDNTPYGGQRRDDNDSYNNQRRGDQQYGGGARRDENPTYGGRRNDDDDNRNSGRQYGGAQQSGGYAPSYGQPQSTYGGSQGGYAPSYGQAQSNYSSGQQGGYGGGRKDDDDDNSRGYGKKSSKRDDDSDDDNRKKHGGYGKKKDDSDDDKYKPSYGGGGRHKKEDSDDDKKYKPAYGGRKDDSDDDKKYKPSYGGGKSRKDDDSDDDRKKGYGKHGGRRDDDDGPSAYGQPGRGGYGGREDDGGFNRGQAGHGGYGGGGNDNRFGQGPGPGGYGGPGREDHGGYGQPGRGGYGGRDETFGVEQLNIGGGGRRRDDDDDDNDGRRRHHGGGQGGYGGQQGREGYGGGGYGGDRY